MPTVLRHGPYRFFFHAGDGREPRHVHVEHDRSHAKFWLLPLDLARSVGFGPSELSRLSRIVADNRFVLMRQWDEFFDT